MALINSSCLKTVCVLWCDREEGGGVRGLSRKTLKQFKCHKVLGQSNPLPAGHLMGTCGSKCRKMSDGVLCVLGKGFVHPCVPTGANV